MIRYPIDDGQHHRPCANCGQVHADLAPTPFPDRAPLVANTMSSLGPDLWRAMHRVAA